MKIAALAGGVGAGKFLRGLIRAVRPENVTVIVNTGDDIEVHGLHVSPDLDSVTYWLSGLADRERGWGRDGETELGRRWNIGCRILPMSDEPVTTRIEAVDDAGQVLDLHFQEYWVRRGAEDAVKAVRFERADRAVPAPGVVEAIAAADCVVICPSNPVVSIDPILAVPGIRDAVQSRRSVVVAISPIVGGAPLRGMADRLLPVVGVEVSAAGVAQHYGSVLMEGFVIDEVDRDAASEIESLGLRVAVTDTIMVDDDAAESLARAALDLAGGAGP